MRQHVQLKELAHFTIQVEHPETREILSFYAKADEPELTLAHVMNLISFDREQGDEFDANFCSSYDSARDEVDYYVQRLVSIEMGDEEVPSRGPIWNVYINGILEDWMEVMRYNRIVCKEDMIEWRYHLRKVDSVVERKPIKERDIAKQPTQPNSVATSAQMRHEKAEAEATGQKHKLVFKEHKK